MTTPLSSRVSTPNHHLLGATSAAPLMSGGLYGMVLMRGFAHRHYAYEISLEYDGVDRRRGDAIITSLLRELSDYRNPRPEDLFTAFVATVAQDHVMSGRSVFELFAADADGAAEPVLAVLPWWSLQRRLWFTFQISPAVDRGRRRRLPASNLIDIVLPGRLGRHLYRVGQSLGVLAARTPAATASAMPPSANYDFAAHQRAIDERAAHATRHIGWPERDAFQQRATDSYHTYRELRFLRTWLTIVEAVTETLNNICGRPDVSMGGDSPRLRITGLPTIRAVDKCLNAVTDGSMSLDEIFRAVLHPRRG